MLSTCPTLDSLFALFPTTPDVPTAEPVEADELPDPYHGLLAHTDHMTVTVEQFYGRPVGVKVLACARDGDEYARQIVLAVPGGRVVQFGLVRIDLGVCPPPVRDAILEGRTPLGRVLIEHDMLRRIEPAGYLRVTPGETLGGWLGCPAGAVTFGRLGVIYTGDRPAIEVLEILTPIY